MVQLRRILVRHAVVLVQVMGVGVDLDLGLRGLLMGLLGLLGLGSVWLFIFLVGGDDIGIEFDLGLLRSLLLLIVGVGFLHGGHLLGGQLLLWGQLLTLLHLIILLLQRAFR